MIIPAWLSVLIANKEIRYFDIILANTSDEAEKNFAIFGKAECLRLGGKDFTADIKQAYDTYQRLDNDQTLTDLRQRVIIAKANCLSVGGKDFPADVKQAYALYQALDNDQTLTDLRQKVIYGKAECSRLLKGNNFQANEKHALSVLPNSSLDNNLITVVAPPPTPPPVNRTAPVLNPPVIPTAIKGMLPAISSSGLTSKRKQPDKVNVSPAITGEPADRTTKSFTVARHNSGILMFSSPETTGSAPVRVILEEETEMQTCNFDEETEMQTTRNLDEEYVRTERYMQ
jgi:hypothetical protein